MQIEELGHNGHSSVEKLVCQQLRPVVKLDF